jgi:hypothetical protein
MDGHMMRIYIDGKRDPNFRVANEVNASTPRPVRIGLADNGLLPFKGEIDEIKIYNRPLTTEEIATAYSMYQMHVLAIKSAFYGIKYILLNTDPTYYETFYTELNPTKTQNIKTHLDTSNDYKLAYSGEDVNIYENLRYRGNAFLIPSSSYDPSDPFHAEDANASIQYFQTDPNTMTIQVENQEPVSLIISQSFSDGWVATIETEPPNGPKFTETLPPSETATIQYIPINNLGKHKITLHYWYYENSLLLYPIFYIPLGIITIALSFKQLHPNKKNFRRFILLPLAVYGVMLTLFSTNIYHFIFPRAFRIYRTPILLLGISLAILPILTYLLMWISRRLQIFIENGGER